MYKVINGRLLSMYVCRYEICHTISNTPLELPSSEECKMMSKSLFIKNYDKDATTADILQIPG